MSTRVSFWLHLLSREQRGNQMDLGNFLVFSGSGELRAMLNSRANEDRLDDPSMGEQWDRCSTQ
jgi:hypothetical protein